MNEADSTVIVKARERFILNGRVVRAGQSIELDPEDASSLLRLELVTPPLGGAPEKEIDEPPRHTAVKRVTTK